MPAGRQCCTVARGQALLLGCDAAEQKAQGPPVLCHMLKLGSVCQVFKFCSEETEQFLPGSCSQSLTPAQWDSCEVINTL